MNYLYYGDNLDVLCQHIGEESVDLIYLDPPFNSKRNYNVLFKDTGGGESTAQVEAFSDSWSWGEASEEAYHQMVEKAPAKLVELMRGFRGFMGESDTMAYLTMMAIRLVELYRVLKDKGSLYLHCDPNASHYLKIVLDIIFGGGNFLNEIVWCYSEREIAKRHWNRKHDVILFYAKNANNKDRTFNSESLTLPYSEGTLKKYNLIDENGRKFQIRGKGGPYTGKQGLHLETEKQNPEWTYRDYLDKKPEIFPRDWFANIPFINRAAKERLGYPTQKPLELLKRIILASSNEGDVILDPFCGCGTSIDAAQELNRRWIGIDITHLAIALIKNRLKDKYGELPYQVIGEPIDLAGAKALAQANKYQFEWWALSLIGARPMGGKKKGADKGIDGVIYFQDDKTGKAKSILVQVKGGQQAGVSQVRDFCSVVDKHKASMGVFITMAEPTKPMKSYAVSQGYYKSPTWDKEFPKIQLLTIEELLGGKKVKRPPAYLTDVTFKQAERHKPGEQLEL